MRLILPLLAVLLLAPAAEAKKRPPCSKGGETIVSNSRARIFEQGDTLRSCNKANRERTVLARSYDEDHVALAGSFVAWFEPAESQVKIFDVATEDERSTAVGTVTELVLTRNGSAAWIEGGEVHALEDAGERVLDTGDVSALEASRTRVTWVNGGELRAAQLA